MDREYLKYLMQSINLRFDARFDDAYTAALEGQLEYVKAQTYDKKYAEVKFRKFLPVDNSVDPGAESIAYYVWDEMGAAELIANYSDDLNMVDAMAEKVTSPIHGMAVAYQYSIQDLRRSAMGNLQLDTRRASMARRAVERKQDAIAAFGDAKSRLKGFLNHPNVPVSTATTDGTSTRWVGGRTTPKTQLLIIKDITDAVDDIVTTTKEIHQPDTILLPTTEGSHVSQTPMSVDSANTLGKFFLSNSPYIKNIDTWAKLNTADAAGTGPRMVVYQRDPEVVEVCIPQEFEQFPPQARNLAFVVPCHARTGGVKFYRPLSAVYVDGI